MEMENIVVALQDIADARLQSVECQHQIQTELIGIDYQLGRIAGGDKGDAKTKTERDEMADHQIKCIDVVIDGAAHRALTIQVTEDGSVLKIDCELQVSCAEYDAIVRQLGTIQTIVLSYGSGQRWSTHCYIEDMGALECNRAGCFCFFRAQVRKIDLPTTITTEIEYRQIYLEALAHHRLAEDLERQENDDELPPLLDWNRI